MAIEIMGASYPVEAGADLSAKQFCVVKMNTSGQIVVITAITDKPYGILQDKPAAAGRSAECWHSGISKLVAGAACDENDSIGFDNAGRGIPLVQGTDTTQYVIGTCVRPVSNAGEIMSVRFDCSQPNRAT